MTTLTFQDRGGAMGLEGILYKGLFRYSDSYSEVVYRRLTTMPSDEGDNNHDTDNTVVPLLGIFTKGPDWLDYMYCGYVSDKYQFIGNENLNHQIRNSIQEVGLPIVNENTLLSYDLTRMRNEIIIQSSRNIPQHGDILPVMIIENSYNGTKAATVSFGLSTFINNERVIFSFNLGEMRQVHIINSSTVMASVISQYMQVFSENIVDLVSQNFRSRLTEDNMLGTLDLIEKIGKKKREEISKFLQEMNPVGEGETPQLPSAWQMFLAIVRYSSFENNLNSKRLLENIAESVLVIPGRMYNVLKQLG